MTAALLLSALGARAELSQVPQMFGSDDALGLQIQQKVKEKNYGVTGAALLGSHQVIKLEFPDVSASFQVQMAPAASSPGLALKPAAGLAPKKTKTKTKKAPRGAKKQLKDVFASDKNWGDKR